MRASVRRVALWAVLWALGGFFLGCAGSPVWEARMALRLGDPAALTVLPEILTAGSIRVQTIPGTDVMELACRGDSPEDAAAALENTLSSLDALLLYLECDPDWETLARNTACLSRPSAGRYVLYAALLGAVAGFLWGLPAPDNRQEISLGEFLTAMGKAARKRLPSILISVLAAAAAAFALTKWLHTPQYEATMLVRIGSYDPDTAESLAAAALGLTDSLLGPEGVEAVRIGKTNLLRLSAAECSEELALSALTQAVRLWPDLASHIPGQPAMTVLEAPALTEISADGALRSMLPAAGGMLAFRCLLLAAAATPRKRGLYAKD